MVSFCTFDSGLDSIVDSAVGSKRFRVCVKTRKGGHSYNDFGRDNAIARLADMISRLYALRVPEKGGRTTYNVA